MRHHYVPQFLLRRWTNAAGKLRIYKMRDGRLTRKDMGPKSTGYENGLYALVAGVLGFGRVRQGGVISAVAVGHRQAALAVMCRG